MTTRHLPAPVFVLSSLLALGVLACDKGKSDDKAEPSAKDPGKKGDEPEPATKAVEPETVAEAVDVGPQIDAEIMADLKAIVANCEVNVSGCTVNKCANDETKTLLDKFELKDGKRPKDRGVAIDTFAAALADPDDKLQTAAVSVMYSGYRVMPDVDAVSPAAAKRLIEAWAKLPKYQANQSITGVVHAVMLSGSDEVANALYSAVEAHPEASKGSAWEALMTYGRVRALPKLQELSKSDDKDTARAALSSFRNMYDVTDEEKAAVCPWIAGFLGDSRPEVFEAAGYGAIRCGGEYVDKLLDEGEKRLSESHEFTRTHYFVFRDVCFSFMGEKTAGQQAQCDRNYAFLQKAVDDAAVESEFRSLALDAIYYQRRDATTKALAQKYLKHKDEAVAKRAAEIVEKLKDK